MRLLIENLAKIKNADICIDGITVIAGENNTGKSTIGKVLYSTFNSLYKLDNKIETKRRQEIQDVFQTLAYEFCAGRHFKVSDSEGRVVSTRMSRIVSQELLKEFFKLSLESKSKEYIEHFILGVFEKYGIKIESEADHEYINEAISQIIIRSDDNNYNVSLELISRFFGFIFDSQVQCLNSEDQKALVHLIIKDRDLILEFSENCCVSLNADFSIQHEAFYIDDPMVLDDLSRVVYVSSNTIKEQLITKLQFKSKDPMEGIFEAVYAKENLKEIYMILNQVTDGKLAVKNGEWFLDSERFVEPIHLDNLSAGLKSFVIIKILLEKGLLKEKDVLILDEPEIHLHPEWQLKYAEIVVLLQKNFDLSIVVTTHSRDFLEAIELYSKKYHLESRCNYYLAVEENGLSTFEHVEGSLRKIYGQLITASMLLDDLRFDLEDSDE